MDSKTIVFSDGSVFELKGTFLEAAKIKYDYPKFDAASPYDELRTERFSCFLKDLQLLSEQYYKEKKVLTKFGVVNWGDYPAKSEYSTIAELAEDIAYALLREVIMSMAFAELNGPKVVVLGENGVTVYDGNTKTVYSSWEEYLSTNTTGIVLLPDRANHSKSFVSNEIAAFPPSFPFSTEETSCCESDDEHCAPVFRGDDEDDIIRERLKHSETTKPELS